MNIWKFGKLPSATQNNSQVANPRSVFLNWLLLSLFFLTQALAVYLSIRIMKLDVESATENLVSQAAGASRSLETQFDALRDDFRVLVSTQAFDVFSDDSADSPREVALVKRFFARYQEMIDQIDLEREDGSIISLQLHPGNYLKSIPLSSTPEYESRKSPSAVIHSSDKLIILEDVPPGAHAKVRSVRLRVDHNKFFRKQLASYLMGQSELWIWSIENDDQPKLIRHPSPFTSPRFSVHPADVTKITSDLKNGLEGTIEHEFFTTNTRKVISVYTPLNLGGESMGLVFSTDREAHLASLYRLATFLGITFLGSLAWLASWFIISVRKIRDSEREQASARTRAETADRAKSEFVTTMSHEIRTPLNGVLGYAKLLMDSPLSPSQRSHVDVIRNSGDHLLTILNDILDFSKIESGTVTLRNEKFSAISCAQEVVDILQTAAVERGLGLFVQVDPSFPPMVNGDSGRLRQVLYNLVGNGIKFTEAGSVTVSLSATSSNNSHQLHFTVTDTGIGIPKEKLDNVFSPFSQVDGSTSRNYGGTGLGLAICKRLIGMMGGTIQIQSQPGKGTSLHFSIPSSSDQLPVDTTPPLHIAPPQFIDAPSLTPRPAGTTFKSKSPPTHSDLVSSHNHHENPAHHSVLIAEDNEINSQLLRILLEQRSCSTTIATNGSEALALLCQKTFDLVFMDVEMPGLDGIEVTRRLRKWELSENQRQTLIIGLSAHAFNEARIEALNAGMDDYLTKPIDLTMLDKVIAQHLKPRHDNDSIELVPA